MKQFLLLIFSIISFSLSLIAMHDADPMVIDMRSRNPYASEGKEEVNATTVQSYKTTPSDYKKETVETWKQLTKRKCLGCVGYMLPGAAVTLTTLFVYFTCYFSDQCPIH